MMARWNVRLWSTFVALLVGGAVAFAGGSLSLNLEVEGAIEAWTSGLSILASFAGEAEVSGTGHLDDVPIGFSADGHFLGEGIHGILELISEGWSVVSATGTTTCGLAVEVHLFLHSRRTSLLPLRRGDLLEGAHYTMLLLGDQTQSFVGTFHGLLEGALEPAKPPLLVRLAGTGTFYLAGEPVAPGHFDMPAIANPEDPQGVSQELAEILDRLFLPSQPVPGDDMGP